MRATGFARARNLSNASSARRATKTLGVAVAPTTSAAARLAHARSSSVHSSRARSAVSTASTAVTASAVRSSMMASQ
jgi:hypothetical protein